MHHDHVLPIQGLKGFSGKAFSAAGGSPKAATAAEAPGTMSDDPVIQHVRNIRAIVLHTYVMIIA